MNKTFFKFTYIIMIGLLFSFTTSSVYAPDWKIDKSHTKIGFEVNHFFSPVVGFFNDYSTELKFDPEDLTSSSASISIKVGSVKTDSDKRDKHLQSGDFFDEQKYPEIKFVSTSFSKSQDAYLVKGKLTIRDTTKEVEIPFNVLGMGDHPMKKGMTNMALRGSVKINRNDYGVGTGSWAATAVVGEEVTINIIIEGNRKS